MFPSQPGQQAVATPAQVAQLRAHLALLCQRIAAVEEELAGTLCAIARTAQAERAERPQTHADAAREYAALERARAEHYAS